jgi:hypothetical protein
MRSAPELSRGAGALARRSGTGTYRVEGGKVAEMWDAWNVLAVLELLGVAPAAAA